MASIHATFLKLFLLICILASFHSAESKEVSGTGEEFFITVANDRWSPRDTIAVRVSEMLHNSSDLGTFFSERLARLGEHWFNVVEADEDIRSTVDYFMQCFDDFDQLHSGLDEYWQEECTKWGLFTKDVTNEFLPVVEKKMQCQGRGGVLFCPKSGFYVRYKDGFSNDGALGALLHTDGGDGYYDPNQWPHIKEYYYNSDVPGGEWVNAWVQLHGKAGRQMLFLDPTSMKQRGLPDGPSLTPYPGREGNATDWRFLVRSDLRAGVGFVWNTTLVPHANGVPANPEARGKVQPTLTVDVRCTCALPEILEVLGPGPRLEHSDIQF